MITLYQFQSCPFCCKVRALLNFIKQPYDVVEVTPFGMKELNFTDHKKVPVLKDGDEVITESASIIEYINEKYAKLSLTDQDKEWTEWVDNTLVHYLPSLIHPDFRTSLRNFKQIVLPEQFGWLKGRMIRFAGAIAMPKVARKMKQKHNISDVKSEYLNAIDYWVENGLKEQPFYGGASPSFVDCSVFGVLRSGHQLGIIKLAKHHNKYFAIWYDKCYPMMSGGRVSNPE